MNSSVGKSLLLGESPHKLCGSLENPLELNDTANMKALENYFNLVVRFWNAASDLLSADEIAPVQQQTDELSSLPLVSLFGAMHAEPCEYQARTEKSSLPRRVFAFICLEIREEWTSVCVEPTSIFESAYIAKPSAVRFARSCHTPPVWFQKYSFREIKAKIWWEK
jgi:hypothetical protein